MSIWFEFFEAGCGDSILVSTDEGTNILIDGGEEGTYSDSIESYLYEHNIDKLDLVVLTHIDNDHICGLIEMLESNDERELIKEIWFNSYEDMRISSNSTGDIAFSEGELFEDLIKEYEIIHRKDIFFTENSSLKERTFNIGSDIKLILLSPLKSDVDKLKIDWKNFKDNEEHDISGVSPFDNRNIEDIYRIFQDKVLKKKGRGETLSSATNTSKANRSSIAFILEYKDDSKFLFLGDADIKVINKSLLDLGFEKINFKFIKLSHHGSKSNINKEFLDIIRTDTFITLTDGTRHNHPHKETFSLILKHEKRAKKIKLFFNYCNPIEYKFSHENNEVNLYNFEAIHSSTLEF